MARRSRYACTVGIFSIIQVIGFATFVMALSSTTSAEIPLTFPNGTRILVELADTNETRARGLMYREHLAADRGMLFVFGEASPWTFWMKNTKVSLDILWVGADKRIVEIMEDIPGCVQDPCTQYQPSKDANYVLEIPAGSVRRQKLAKGMALSFNLPKH